MRLLATVSYQMASIEEREAVANGCGPAWMPEWMRRVFDSIFGHSVREACAIHDWDYYHRYRREEADRRFWLNLRLLIKDTSNGSHWDLARYVVAYGYYLLVRVFGYFIYRKG